MRRVLLHTLALAAVWALLVPMADAQRRRERGAPVEVQPAAPPAQAVPAPPAQPVPAPPANPATPAPGTEVQGQVVRVIGQDQVVIRTPDGKEMIVRVDPQTVYSFNNQPGRFTDLQPGANVGVNYYTRDRHPVARRIFGLPRNR